MERESFKEYSEVAIIVKAELYAMKSCFEELHTILSMRSKNTSLEVKTKGVKKQPRSLTVKEITFFDGNLC